MSVGAISYSVYTSNQTIVSSPPVNGLVPDARAVVRGYAQKALQGMYNRVECMASDVFLI